MKFMKNVKWTNIILAAASIAAGLLLLVYPSASADFICTIIGIVLIIWGVVRIAAYFMMDVRDTLFRNDFASGIVLVLLGILVIHFKSVFEQIVPFLLSIAIIASGFQKLQDGIDAKRLGSSGSWSYLILALISIVFGLIIMFNLKGSTKLMYQIIGAALLYSGATDLYFSIYLSGKIRKFVKKADESIINADAKTIDEETEDSNQGDGQ